MRETVALPRSEAVRYNISVRTELAADLPQILGDRVRNLAHLPIQDPTRYTVAIELKTANAPQEEIE